VDKAGNPQPGVAVQLFMRGLGATEAPGGKPALTDAEGRFTLKYEGRPGADVHVAARKGRRRLGESDLIVGIDSSRDVDIVVSRSDAPMPTDFARAASRVSDALRELGDRSGSLVNLGEADMAHVAATTGLSPARLSSIKRSQQLQRETRIPAEILDAFTGRRGPTNLDGLLAAGPAKRRRMIKLALDSGHLPADQEKPALAALDRLDELAIKEALAQPRDPQASTLGLLLRAMGIPRSKQEKLVRAYVRHEGPIEGYWKAIRTRREFADLSDQEVDRIQLGLQLGVVTQNHVPMVRALLQEGVATARDLAKITKKDWLRLIMQRQGNNAVGVPADLEAAGMTAGQYADQLHAAVEDAYPTAMLAGQLDGLPNGQLLAQFFDSNPTYEMRDTPVAAFLRENPQALKGIKDPGGLVISSLKRIERVYKLAPRGAKVDTIKQLVADGLDSAQKIRTMGQAAFLRNYEPKFGAEGARSVFLRANNASATATVLLANYGAMFNTTPMSALPALPDSINAFPDWKSLFGSLDFCSCEHCLSVYSPSAYLVDVLMWLKNRTATGGTGLDVLFNARRGDLGTIELSCHNTNTPLPYVDLVNEILELQVSPANPTPRYQTEGEAADLAVHPEHLHAPAYEILAGQSTGSRDGVYPFNLPFNLWVTEARVYLGQLGVPRHALMTAFHTGGIAAARTDEAVTRETLGLGGIEARLIAGETLAPNRPHRDFWGLRGDGAWVDKLRTVSTLLAKATPPLEGRGMEFKELAELLRAGFVQTTGPVEVWFQDPTCDIGSARLTGLTGDTLHRLQRFIRLQRRLGWSVRDLDLAISVLGGGVLDAGLLVKLAHLESLRGRLRLPLAELLGWWGPIDTRRWEGRLREGRPAEIAAGATGLGMVYDPRLSDLPDADSGESVYDHLFLSRTVSDEPNRAFLLKADGFALLDETTQLGDFTPTIAAALNLTADDLSQLTETLPDQHLSLANLSSLSRHASLAAALGLTSRQLVSMKDLTGIDPFDGAHPDDTLRFVDEAEAVAASGFSIEELDYLLRHRDTKPKSLEPTEGVIGGTLRDLRDRLRQAEADNPAPAAVSQDRSFEELLQFTTSKLATVLPADQLKTAITIIDLDPAVPRPSNAVQEQFIDDHLATFLDAVATKTALVGAAQITDRTNRLKVVLEPLLQHLRRRAVEGTIVQTLAEVLEVDAAVVDPAVRSYLHDPGDPTVTALAVFADRVLIDWEPPETDIDAPPTEAEVGTQFATYRKLDKVALVLRRFRITREELPWVMQHGPATGTLDLDALPANSGFSAPYGAWARLRDAVAVRDAHTTGRLFDLFTGAAAFAAGGDVAAATAAFYDNLEERTRWNRSDFEHLAGASAFNFQYPNDWKDERAFKALATAMSVVRRVGLPAADLWAWRTVPDAVADQQSQAAAVKEAVRARYDDAQWREVAGPLRDQLREQQRDALVGWLVAHDGRFGSPADLYAHFLIDIEMSPCQLTSRIKQAISSAQLFIQRALMNLEPQLMLTHADAREWKWMKNYRVWEANRKVFLYPENWLEPELRDNKTPFFTTLENDLLQGEITDEAAEGALRSYLQRLDEVARLQVVAVYHHKDPPTDVLHVIGRTRGTPHTYFYRRRVDSKEWTPWEEVEVDIEGDHLLPIVFNRRLYLFWPLFTEAAIEAVPATPSNFGVNTADEPIRYYQLRLAWTEYQSGKWARRRMSEGRIGDNPTDYGRLTCALKKSPMSTVYDYFLRASELDSGDLIVQPIRAVYGKKDDKKGAAYFQLDRFRMSGCDGMVTIEAATDEKALVRIPEKTRVHAQHFYGPKATDELELPTRNASTGTYQMEETLRETPSAFLVAPSHQDPSFYSQRPFFFEDERRSFLVLPTDRYAVRPTWPIAEAIPLDYHAIVSEFPARPLPPGPDPWVADPASQVLIPDEVMVEPPALPLADTHGLLRVGAAALISTLGSAVGVLDGKPIVGIQRTASVNTRARILGSDGKELLALSSGRAASLTKDRPMLAIETVHQFPRIVEPSFRLLPTLAWVGKRYRFHVFYHPYVCDMLRQLNRIGVSGLLDPQPDGPAPDLRRQAKKDDETFFASQYQPVAVGAPYPQDDFDFSYGGAYSSYNWELFFHVPFRIAVSLSQNQRFEDALKWFHYIFDPTESSSEQAPQRFWKLKPFFELFYAEDAEAGPIHQLLLLLHYRGNDPDKLDAREQLIAQIAEWRKNPLQPHAIARLRLTAYQKAVVIKYIDNLIDWGDQLFRRDTMESINEATLLYVLASEILGDRPQEVPVKAPAPRTFDELAAAGLDEFSNVLIEEIEGYLPTMPDSDADSLEDDVPILGPTLFFCVPPNQKLITDYWDRVDDRLFKIRNCMNIEGVIRQLPLFEPPLDPALLVRAAAAGLDLSSVLADLYAPMPHHRYRVLSQRALELCSDVQSLGGALLAALEKRDAEELALIQAEHEVKLRSAMRQIHQQRIDESEEALEALKKSQESAEIRRDFYQSRTFMNEEETSAEARAQAAGIAEVIANAATAVSSFMGASPNVSVGASGFGGSPHVTVSYGGSTLGAISHGTADVARGVASALDRASRSAGTQGSYQRRQDDWTHQAELASVEVANIERQILAAEIRLAIANRELENWELQIEQSQAIEDYLLGRDSARPRFATKDLYSWMVGKVSSLYFQAYKLAYDLAKSAERAWQLELGPTDSSFIEFGYWDGLRKGLLAGERLRHDLRRMEVAYLDQNRREFELTKHVSLRALDPIALARLREDGQCFVRIPEAWYDLDTPGHYMRRIKTVSLSIPSVTGPYASTRCTLTLVRNETRVSPSGGYQRTGPADSRFRDDVVGVQSIVTSNAVQDAGLFETSLQDERYLPFEGAGATSEWRIELPGTFRQFDYRTIADVILHIRYTARDGGQALRSTVQNALEAALKDVVLGSNDERGIGDKEGLLTAFSVRQDFADAWRRFMNPPAAQTDQVLSFEVSQDGFPYVFDDMTIKIHGAELIVVTDDVADYAGGSSMKLDLKPSATGATTTMDLKSTPGIYGGLPAVATTFSAPKKPGPWSITFQEAVNAGVTGVAEIIDGHLRLKRDSLDDLMLIVRYSVSAS
jgi:hypothetical protein